MDQDRPEPLIHAEWMHQLQSALIEDDLGTLAGDLWRTNPLFLVRVFGDIQGAGIWCDDVRTPQTEDCAAAASRSLDATLAELRGRHGPDPHRWRWGDAHVAMQDHAVLGGLPILGLAVNIRQPTSGGDDTLLRGLTRGTTEGRHENIHAAGYRAVYDLADRSRSLFVTATGQSGHPLSRHYRDLAALWGAGAYIPVPADLGPSPEEPMQILRLRPGSRDSGAAQSGD